MYFSCQVISKGMEVWRGGRSNLFEKVNEHLMSTSLSLGFTIITCFTSHTYPASVNVIANAANAGTIIVNGVTDFLIVLFPIARY